MAVGGLSERLAFILEVDGDGAISGFRRVGDTAERELGRADNRLDKLGGRMQVAGAGALAFAGVAGRALISTGRDASNLGEVMSKNTVVFGDAAARVEDFAENAAKIGQSKRGALEAATGFGNLFVSMGLANDKSAEMSLNLTGLASDLASFSNSSPEEAILALSSALIGEAEPIRRYGVLLDDATLKQKALDMGLVQSTTGTLPPAIRAQAAYAAILEQTTTAQGDFERTSGSAANQQRVFAAEMENFRAKIGEGVLPVMTQLLSTASSVVGGIGELDAVTSGAVGSMATWGSVTLGAVGAVSVMAGTVLKMRERFQQLDPATGMATGKLNNFGRVAAGLGIAGTVAGLVQMGRSMSDLSISAGQLTEALNDTTDAGKKKLNTWIALADSEGKLDNIVRNAAATDVIAAEKLIDRAEAAGVAADKVAELREITEGKRQTDITGRANQEQYNAELGVGADSADDMADSTAGLTEKLKAQKEAIEGVIDATLAQFDSNLGYRKSIDETEGSLAGLLETQKEHGTNSEEYRDALMDAEGALLSQAGAAVKLAEDQARANGETLDAQAKARVYRAELANLAASLAPGSPLRTQIEGYIADLDSIPAEVSTRLLADAGGSFGTLQQFLTYLDAINVSGSRATGFTSLLTFKQRQLRASGGDLPPGQVLVGEGGLPEIVERDAGGGMKVIDGQRTRSRLAKGGSTGGVTINMYGSDATADEVARALTWLGRGL